MGCRLMVHVAVAVITSSFDRTHGAMLTPRATLSLSFAAPDKQQQFHCLNRKGLPHAPAFTSKQYKDTEQVPGYPNK